MVTLTTAQNLSCASGSTDKFGNCISGTTVAPATAPAGAFQTTDAHLYPTGCAKGMCVPNATKLLASLNLNDRPLGDYKPQLGPDATVTISYNHQDTLQPATPNYGNLGPRWTQSFNSYIQDEPAVAGNRVTRYAMGGGGVDYTAEVGVFNSTSGAFPMEPQGGAVLKRIPASGTVTSYTLTSPDGTVQTFGKLDGASTFPRRVFLTKLTDPQGNYLTLAYDSSNRLTTITDAESRVTNFCYDPTRSNCSTYSGTSLLISQITDPFGRSAVFSYSSGLLSSIQDVLGITSSFTYDSGTGSDPYFIAQLTTPYGNSNFTGGVDYSQGIRWLELTDPDGNTERVEYNQTNSAIGATESSTPSGMTVENGAYNQYNTFYWDKYVYPTYGTGGGKDYTKAEITHWTLLPLGSIPSAIPASVKKPSENRVYYTYPGQSTTFPQQVGTLDKPSAIGRVMDDSSTKLDKFTYNSLGFVTDHLDPLARETTYTYDTNNIDLLTVKQLTASGPTYTTIDAFTYNGTHEVLTHTDAASQVWRYCYNGSGQLTQAIDPANYGSGSACGSYGSVGTRPSYDGTGRVSSVTNAAGSTQVTYTYPSTCSTTGGVNCDLPLTVTDSEGRAVSYTRDALDRVTTATYPDSTTDQYDYTFQSGPNTGTESLDLRKYTDRLSRVTTNTYDAERRLASTTDPLSHTVSYTYFADGTLNTLTDQNSHTTTWAIDVQSRPTLKTFADSKTIAYAYESTTSRLKSVTDYLSQVKTYGYDDADELTGITYTGSVITTPNVTFSWDTYFPRRTGMTDGNGSTSWSYVAIGTNGALSLDTENGAFSNDSAVYTYDADGRVAGLTEGGAAAESWSYDALGRISTHGTSLGTFTYTYLGQTNQEAGRSLGGTSISTSLGYDTNTNDRRLLTLTHNSGARSYTLSYGTSPVNVYDVKENAETSPGGHPYAANDWVYTYDSTDELLTQGINGGSTTYTYAYDPAANMTTFTSTTATSNPTYNNLNQIATQSTTTFAYNNVGDTTTGGTDTYTWDAEDRVHVISITGTSKTNTFIYDGLGRRVETDFYDGTTTTATRFGWCPNSPVTPGSTGSVICEKRNGSDTVKTRYFDEGQYTLSSALKLVTTKDESGAVRDVINAGTGAWAKAWDWSPYGMEKRTSGSGTPDFIWGGMFWDNNVNLYYSATRVYDAKIGRFITRDPIAESGGVNLYEYAGGNPISNVDPSGLNSQVSVSVGGTFGFINRGVSGSFGGGLSVGDKPWKLGQWQFFLNAQTNTMQGGGMYLGGGAGYGLSHHDGPLTPGLSSESGDYAEADVGPVGGSIQGQSGCNMNSAGSGLPGKVGERTGGGVGLWVGSGQYNSSTYAFPTFQQQYNGFIDKGGAILAPILY